MTSQFPFVSRESEIKLTTKCIFSTICHSNVNNSLVIMLLYIQKRNQTDIRKITLQIKNKFMFIIISAFSLVLPFFRLQKYDRNNYLPRQCLSGFWILAIQVSWLIVLGLKVKDSWHFAFEISGSMSLIAKVVSLVILPFFKLFTHDLRFHSLFVVVRKWFFLLVISITGNIFFCTFTRIAVLSTFL